ncbi:hypothetical protein Lfu02_36380 [Longispora fulva]|nr:hypothetical protein Lfu02_36380 [Longispora fulva]
MFPPENREITLRTVGGYLIGADSRIRPAAELRTFLRAWLQPLDGRSTASSRLTHDLETFFASWGLSNRATALERWRALGSPVRIDPTPYLKRATGWGDNKPTSDGHFRYEHLEAAELYPDRAAGRLVDDGVAQLLNVGLAWGEPKPGRLEMEMRQWLTPRVASQLKLFDQSTQGSPGTPTTEVTRLAFLLAVGAALRRYVEFRPDRARPEDAVFLALATDLESDWSNPPELEELIQLSVDTDLLGAHGDQGPQEDLGVEFADFRAVFRTFARTGRDFGLAPRPTSAFGEDAALWTSRRLAIILELAISDVRVGSSELRSPVADQLASLVDRLVDTMVRQKDTSEMLELQRELRSRSVSPPGRNSPQESGTFLHDLLARLTASGRKGTTALSRSDTPADWKSIDMLVFNATNYLAGSGRLGPEGLLKSFAAELPAAVTALTSGKDGVAELALPPVDARWQLLEASGRALISRPDAVGSIVVAGSFAELGWFVANEQPPHRMREIFDSVQQELRSLSNGQLAFDLAGTITRILRARPLADSKKANFHIAQRVADESVKYGAWVLRNVVRTEHALTVSRVMAALTGLQLSLLQAGGVYVRSAETELIVEMGQRVNSRARQWHPEYIRDLATSAYTFTNLAVARLHEIRTAHKAGLVTFRELNYPTTAAASTASMGMRTLLLWATMHLAYPDRQPREVSLLVQSVPAQFCDMLKLEHLSSLNFAEMTRIAMYYAFLSGDFSHPARGARTWHPETPPHLRPTAGALLDLDACDQYLIEKGFDTGILDVLHVDRIFRLLNETSEGRYKSWRDNDANPLKRKPERFTRGPTHMAFAQAWDTTLNL